MTPAIQSLHKLYCEMTGFQLSMKYDRERYWYEFQHEGFTADDLRLVIEYLKHGIRTKKRNPGCLKFDNLIRNPDWFEMELAEARAYSRNNPRQTNRDKVIQVFRPTVKENLTVAQEKRADEVSEQLIRALRKAAE